MTWPATATAYDEMVAKTKTGEPYVTHQWLDPEIKWTKKQRRKA